MTKLQRWKRDKWLPGVRDGVKAGKKLDVAIKGQHVRMKTFFYFSLTMSATGCGTKLQFCTMLPGRRN